MNSPVEAAHAILPVLWTNKTLANAVEARWSGIFSGRRGGRIDVSPIGVGV
jgi:hypothetical protein